MLAELKKEFILFIFAEDTYWVAPTSERCPINAVITTEIGCVAASKELGLEYRSGEIYHGGPAGCYRYTDINWGTHFNYVIDPSSSSPLFNSKEMGFNII